MRFKIKNRTSTPQTKFAKAKAAYKDNIAIMKDTLDVVLKLGVMLSIPVGVIIWLYLHSFGWTSLFYKATASSLGFLLIVGIVVASALLFMFTVPSMLMMVTSEIYDKERTIPKHAVRLYLVALIAWILTLCLIAVFGSVLPFWMPPLVTLVVTTIFSAINIDALLFMPRQSSSSLKRYGQAAALALLATFSTCGIVYPLLISSSTASQYNHISGWQMYAAIAICILVSMVSVVPGFAYLQARTRTKGYQKPYKMALIAMTVVVWTLACAVLLVPQLRLVFLRTAGVYSEERIVFQVLQPNLMPAFAAAGIRLEPSTMDTVSTCVRYNVAGTMLLCKDPFDPDFVDTNSAREAKRSKRLNLDGQNCVPVSSSELREIRLSTAPVSCIRTTPATPGTGTAAR